jgi:hypothetical protein
MGVFNAGGVIRAFNPDKVVRKPLFEPLDTNFTEQSGRASRISGLNEADEAAFGQELNRVRPQVQRMGEEDIGTLRGVINRLGGTSAMDTYRGIGDYQKSLIDSVATGLASQGMGRLALSRARLGYGGRGPSSFDTSRITNLISQNLAPVYSNAFSNIGRDVGTVNQSDINNINTLMSVIGERAGIPLRGLDLYQLGSQYRNQNQSEELANLSALVNAVKAGTAGFEKKTNKWADAMSAVDEGLNSALDMAMSLYSGGMMGGGGGGGGMGGMLGGMMGGGGGGGGGGNKTLGNPNNRAFSDIFSYSPSYSIPPAPQAGSVNPYFTPQQMPSYFIPQSPYAGGAPTINPYG